MYVRGEIVVDGEQLAITRSQDQITMSADSFGPCRKFLAAMSKRAFDPKSEHLDVSWRLQKAPDVDHTEVAPFLKKGIVQSRGGCETYAGRRASHVRCRDMEHA